MMKTKMKLKRENRKRLKTKTKMPNSKTCHSTKVLAYTVVLTGAMAGQR